jgi:hypothetical protein
MKIDLDVTPKPTKQPRAKADKVLESPSATVDGEVERARFRFPRSLTVVPVRADGSPDWSHRAAGVPLDVMADGELELNMENAPELPTTALIVLLEEEDGTRRVTAIDIQSKVAWENGGLRIIGRVGGFAEEILNPEKLTPTLDKKTMRFQLCIAPQVLDQWAAIGALERVLIDKVQVCPRCQGMPTYREGCPNCGSANLENDLLIHHFACAHVGRISDFEAGGDLVCPKCLVRHLVVASDFDYVKGPYRCLGCHWNNVEPEQVAECLRCQYRFPAYQASTQELRGYRAHRLDPLAYLPAS